MPGSGTRTFLETDRYEASLRQAQIDTIVTSGGKFKARLTWAELHHLQLLRCEEDLPRIAYLSLTSRLGCRGRKISGTRCLGHCLPRPERLFLPWSLRSSSKTNSLTMSSYRGWTDSCSSTTLHDWAA